MSILKLFTFLGLQAKCVATGSNPEPTMQLSLGDQVLSTTVTAQRSIDANNRVSYTGEVSDSVELTAKTETQYLTCDASIQHGVMPTQHAGLAIKVNVGTV